METHVLVLTFQEASTRYGLSSAVLQEFLQAGLLRSAPAPGTVIVDEPEDLLCLARLHHELELPVEALDVVLAMRQRLERLQALLAAERARSRQLEDFLRGAGPLEEL